MKSIIDRKFKIFLVDDDLFYLKITQKLLENMGCENITAFKNGVDCLNHIHEKPDIIFLDYDMDIFSGYEVLTKIKRYDPNIFVVMLSGQDDITVAVRTLKFGALDYIEKGKDEEEKLDNVITRIGKIENVLHKNRRRKIRFMPRIF